MIRSCVANRSKRYADLTRDDKAVFFKKFRSSKVRRPTGPSHQEEAVVLCVACTLVNPLSTHKFSVRRVVIYCFSLYRHDTSAAEQPQECKNSSNMDGTCPQRLRAAAAAKSGTRN
jgi:hypothetical protein